MRLTIRKDMARIKAEAKVRLDALFGETAERRREKRLQALAYLITGDPATAPTLVIEADAGHGTIDDLAASVLVKAARVLEDEPARQAAQAGIEAARTEPEVLAILGGLPPR